MNERNNRKLDAMSNIDDELIEKSTKKRIFLLKRAQKKKTRRNIFISVTASAASFFMILGVILAVVILFGKIPVYTGMSISNTFPITQAEVAANPDDYVKITMTGKSMKVTPVTMLSNGAEISDETSDDTTEETTSSLQIDEETEKTYYAKVNEDIYITVHLKNPDNYAILQFTLNGKVYNSYMFEEGSDMENLVLKYNVGDKVGYAEYTIDAIKYVDGTEIKDVRMDGDRTVTVAVGAQDPTVDSIKINKKTAFEIDCSVMLSDPDDMIKKSNGRAYAVLLDANTDLEHISLQSVVAKKEVAVGNISNFVLDGLKQQTDYILAIVAVYDAYDGEGLTLHLLSKTNDSDEPNEEGSEASEEKAVYKVSTPPIVNFSVYAEKGSVRFVLSPWGETAKALVAVTKIELLNYAKEVVAEGDADTEIFENVPCGTYYGRVTFIFDNNDGKGQQTGSYTSGEIIVEPWGLQLTGELVECGTQGEGNFAFTPGADGKVYAPMDGVMQIGAYLDGSYSVSIFCKADFGITYFITYSYLQSVPEELKAADLEHPAGFSVSAGDLIGIGGTTDINDDCVAPEPHIHVHYYVRGGLGRWHSQSWESVISGEYSPFDSGLFVFVDPNEE